MALTKNSGTVVRKASEPPTLPPKRTRKSRTKVEETTVVLDEPDNEESV